MSPEPSRLRRYITEFNFKQLFIEELGWDNASPTPLTVTVDGAPYTLRPVAEKRGIVLLSCPQIPPYAVRRQIDREVTKYHREHLIVFAAPDQAAQVWLWVRREAGKPSAGRERHYYRGESGERVAQTLAGLAFALEEEGQLTLIEGVSRVRAAFDVDRVTRRFYDRFKREHDAFLKFITGIPDSEFQRWYASVMINRIMFIYFVQRKGFLAGDVDYLATRLAETERSGGNYYRDFLRVLFFQGFAIREDERTPAVNRLLGKAPYLNGGLFAVHTVEEQYGAAIQIPNEAFHKLYAFFDEYNWHLDERPLRNDNEINPDVLGYIFEKYINQKQMGAYYTKEDITDYICKNVMLPFLLDAVRREVPAAFDTSTDLQVMLGQRSATDTPTVWRLLAEDPNRYIYPAVRHGAELPLPANIAVGVDDVSQRGEWNRSAPPEYALPTEIWREVVARRRRYAEVREKLASGGVTASDDLITLNLNIRQFARDVIDTCTAPALLRAFWQALRSLAVLDPTGGSGAFLFAALTILEDLYDACLERMEWFLAEQHAAPPTDTRLADFRATLAEVDRHPNRRYFILKSIMVNNLYAVDIMEEAVEICKLRLFLKLVAQVERVDQVEPLPDIDFNIRAGNTLVGFVTREDVKTALALEQKGGGAAQGRMIFGEDQSAIERIEGKAKEIDKAFVDFRRLQTQMDVPADSLSTAKAGLKAKLAALNDELNRLLARQYGVKVERAADYRRWLESHKPFHWFVEFYGVLQRGGFDAIVGNPPYLEVSTVRTSYTFLNFVTESTGNLYALCIERSTALLKAVGMLGMVVQQPIVSTKRMQVVRDLLADKSQCLFSSTYDDRPSKLFDGMHHARIAIIVARRSPTSSKCELYVTKYQKWYKEERSTLFDRTAYFASDSHRLLGIFPKIDSELEAQLLKKIVTQEGSFGAWLSPSSTSHCVYYKITGVGHWFTITLRSPRFLRDGAESSSTREQVMCFPDRNSMYRAFVTLNSTLFYWFYQVRTNCRDFNPSDYRTFPVPKSLADQDMSGLGQQLQESLDRSSLFSSVSHSKTGSIAYERFSPRNAKPIIDEIDRVLARHYGFTDEELDYILNYDIKYRLGADEESTD